MKIFEVITEHCEVDSDAIITTRQYVTSGKDTILSVAEHYDRHCREYEKDLMSIREVVIVTETIE